MGSWSVYCGISNITITSGTRVALVPIHTISGISESRDMFHYSLPIFGVYNDYGGIENIEEDFNTKILEKLHNCDIETFCECLTRMDIQSTNKEVEETLKNIKYMWIIRDVYDFMVSYHPNEYDRVGAFDIGKKSILTALGFNYIGEGKDTRYKYV